MTTLHHPYLCTKIKLLTKCFIFQLNEIKRNLLFFLLKGAHVTINARSSDDVEESVVLEKVKSASGITNTD